MAGPRGSSEVTKGKILTAARELFAERGISEVTVRDIAAMAGVNHALAHRYFGTKEEMVAEILRREVAAYEARSQAVAAAAGEGLEGLSDVFKLALTDARTTILLMMRAELAGLQPEKMLEGERPLRVLADGIRQHQEQSGAREACADPALVSAVVGASIFSFVCMAPWLMTAVGLQPEDYDSRRDEIVDILANIVACACGPSPA